MVMHYESILIPPRLGDLDIVAIMYPFWIPPRCGAVGTPRM